MSIKLTIDDVLRGTAPGRMQSAGHMQVIPLLGDDDDRYDAPDVEVRTTAYGTVQLRHEGERPTIIPPGAGWVVEQAAQDHAIGGGVLLASKSRATITTARCIQQSQGGYITAAKHPMLILPAALRSQALAVRNEAGFGMLWEPIASFNASVGASRSGHLDYFLSRFATELDRFVAEFELVPDQVGALVLVGGRVAGVERAPSSSFWRALWEPLIRVCYGSLAIQRGQGHDAPPPTRVALDGHASSVGELRMAVALAKARERELVAAVIDELRELDLRASDEPDQVLGRTELVTLASERLAGQIVREGDRISYASLAAAQLRVAKSKAGPEREARGEVGCEAEPESSANRTSWLDRVRAWLRGG